MSSKGVLTGFAAAVVAMVSFGARAGEKTPVPADAGLYLGSGVYGNAGKMYHGGFCSTYWAPEKLSPAEAVDLCLKEGVGNTLQFWQKNEKLVELAELAKAKGLYTTCMYAAATNGLAKKMVDSLGPMYIGHDFGEIFSFSLYQEWKDRGATLGDLQNEYMGRVRKHVDKLHKEGWGRVMATSAAFNLDCEVAAGVEIPCSEDYPFGDLTLASALGRGLYRQYDLPLWGSHLAHEWYSWLPHRNPHKMRSLTTAMQLKYMTGAKVIINESGNWQLQSYLCDDSPMKLLPITIRNSHTKMTPEVRAKYADTALAEGRKKFPYIDYRSPIATKYRKLIADFYSFCKQNPAPKGQPEATWAIAKGHHDLGGARHIAGGAICAAYDLAAKNPQWMSGLPEQSWETLRNAVMPMPPMFAPHMNIHFSATPYGLCDIVSFADDSVSAAYLLRNYKVLIFSGWNTCTPRQYKTLCDYVKGGGVLVIGLCHLSTDDQRNYSSFGVKDLINGGDLSALCGFKVTGQSSRRYWATGPSTTPNCLGFYSRRRWGYMCLPLGLLEFTQPKESFEMLSVDDEEEIPFIVRCRNGKGQVLFMNWWAYPAAANMDVGPGAELEQVGMVGHLFRYAAKLGRGNVFITGPDFENPDEDCRWVVYSYFPDAGKICFLNLDYERERKFVLQSFGDKDFLTLAPGEFRLMDAPKLDADEKLNAE